METKCLGGAIGSGVIFSSDYGTTWIPVNNGVTNNRVNTVAINGTTVFAGTDEGVFLSGNDGSVWTQANLGISTVKVKALLNLGILFSQEPTY